MCHEYVAEQGRELYELVRNQRCTVSCILWTKYVEIYSRKRLSGAWLIINCWLLGDLPFSSSSESMWGFVLFLFRPDLDLLSLALQVAHLPDKANNYLTPALSVLEKNTWDCLSSPCLILPHVQKGVHSLRLHPQTGSSGELGRALSHMWMHV